MEPNPRRIYEPQRNWVPFSFLFFSFYQHIMNIHFLLCYISFFMTHHDHDHVQQQVVKSIETIFLLALPAMSSSKKSLIITNNLEEASVNLLNQLVKVKQNSRISYFLILVFIAWLIHKWIFSFSNCLPIILLLFASTQVCNLSLSLSLNEIVFQLLLILHLYFAVWELPAENT